MKYRAVVRQDNEKTFVVIQRKESWYNPWTYFSSVSSLEEADNLIKGISTGTITTGVWNYDQSGNRLIEW